MKLTSQQLQIRVATEADLRALVDVEEAESKAKYVNEALGVTPAVLEAIGWGDVRAAKYRERYLADDRGRMWVAEVDGKVVAYAAAKKEDQANRLAKMYVAGAYQRQGIGQALLNAAEAWLGQTKEIWLGVASYDRTGIDFYYRHGYREGGSRLPEHTTVPAAGVVIPETLMIKRFMA